MLNRELYAALAYLVKVNTLHRINAVGLERVRDAERRAVDALKAAHGLFLESPIHVPTIDDPPYGPPVEPVGVFKSIDVPQRAEKEEIMKRGSKVMPWPERKLRNDTIRADVRTLVDAGEKTKIAFGIVADKYGVSDSTVLNVYYQISNYTPTGRTYKKRGKAPNPALRVRNDEIRARYEVLKAETSTKDTILFEDIGKEFGVSAETIRQIVKRLGSYSDAKMLAALDRNKPAAQPVEEVRANDE